MRPRLEYGGKHALQAKAPPRVSRASHTEETCSIVVFDARPYHIPGPSLPKPALRVRRPSGATDGLNDDPQGGTTLAIARPSDAHSGDLLPRVGTETKKVPP